MSTRTPSPSVTVWIVAGVFLLLGVAVFFARPIFGYAMGRIEAGQAVAAGRPELRTIGRADPQGRFDPETGLFCVTIGCVDTGWESGYMRGWNSVIRAACTRGDCESASLRHKVRKIEDVTAAFAADPGVPLDEHTRLADQSGRFEVSLDQGSIKVHVSGEDHDRYPFFDARGARVLFADGGTTLLVASSPPNQRAFHTVDLPSARVMQSWSEWIGPRPESKGCPGPPGGR